MFRARRYRIFIIFSVIAIGLFYHFNKVGDIQNAGAASVERLKHLGTSSTAAEAKGAQGNEASKPGEGNQVKRPALEVASKSSVSTSSADPPSKVDKDDQRTQSPLQDAPKDAHKVVAAEKDDLDRHSTGQGSGAKEQSTSSVLSPVLSNSSLDVQSEKPRKADKSGKGNEISRRPDTEESNSKGRLEVEEDPNIPKIHWSQLPEHFPVPTQSVISLPTASPKKLPRIQHDFSAVKSSELVQQDKLDIIKETFVFSWTGYRQKAWKQDELKPKSGKYRNPFCGWGATLIDSLDTLYLMGLDDELEEALEAVAETDFTTSQRNDIPLFETVIRYLGGLLSAYDLTKGAHRVLLDKAVELAEILIGAFDTPNRMPVTFYLWKPTFASQPHRAKTNVVLAELGSLSLEFTRLAQITKEQKYYDAVARITNELEIWQKNTSIPGLWPLRVDASGCKKPSSGSSGRNSQSEGDKKSEKAAKAAGQNTVIDTVEKGGRSDDTISAGTSGGSTAMPRQNPSLDLDSKKSADDAPSAGGSSRPQTDRSTQNEVKVKRDQLLEPDAKIQHTPASKPEDDPHCEPQGLDSPALLTIEEYGLGGLADSTYEYLPKEYILLGGAESQYKTMYESAAEAAKKHLLFRPMIADEKRSILQAGLLKFNKKSRDSGSSRFQPEGTHLTCFVGGMFAVGAKTFDRPADLDLASKLTDGCVWAYESMKTGLMPETFLSVPCEQIDNCPWNETLWKDKLDTYRAQRESNQLIQQQTQKTMVEKQELGQASVEKSLPPLNHKGSEPADADAASGLEKGQGSAVKAGAGKVQKSSSQDDAPGIDEAAPSNSNGKVLQPEQTKSSTLPNNGQKSSQKGISEAPLNEPSTKKPLSKRQLGDVSDDHQTPISEKLTKNADNTKGADSDSDSKTGLGSAEQSKGTSQVTAASRQDGSAAKDTNTVDEAQAAPPKRKASADEDTSNSATHPSTSVAAPQNGKDTTKPSAQTQSHEEFVEEKIKQEGLPPGMTKITGGRYLLRPEAIESVFIMYRVTGKEYWRTKGWEMFKAIQQHTNSTFGASAISDVTKENPKRLDEMESFWLAETLKYFWLLFSDPSTVSLDDYVLNTEAHPFKRPVAPQ